MVCFVTAFFGSPWDALGEQLWIPAQAHDEAVAEVHPVFLALHSTATSGDDALLVRRHLPEHCRLHLTETVLAFCRKDVRDAHLRHLLDDFVAVLAEKEHVKDTIDRDREGKVSAKGAQSAKHRKGRASRWKSRLGEELSAALRFG